MFRKIRSQHRILSSLERQIYWAEYKTDFDKQRLGLRYGVCKQRLREVASTPGAIGASFVSGFVLGLLPAPTKAMASWLGALFTVTARSIANYLIFDQLLDEKTERKQS